MTPYHRLALALLTSFMLASCTPQDQGQTQTPETEAVDSVFLEELTWMEVRDALASGKTTILIPTGGVEQNGPHMALGKHNAILEVTMERVARRLGDTLVAPIVTYVPEGDIDPPSGHMRFPGTITLPPEHFAMLLEYAARSLAAHGFRDIVLIGDSGGNQESMSKVSELLNQEWADSDSRVHFVGEYYSANGFREWLESQGETEEGIGRHAGITDTSQLMVAAPHLVRADKVALEGGFEGSGVRGDPTRASIEYGHKGLEMKVETAVAKIRELRSSSR